MDRNKKGFGHHFLLILLFISSFSKSSLAEGIKVYNLFASDEPEKYLKDVNYLPLKEKAAEIAKMWSNNGKKAEAIANWVGSSKDYDVDALKELGMGIPIVFSADRSNIATLFHSKRGWCSDAAFLTVAMLRAVKIPARVLSDFKQKGEPGHAFGQVFFAQKWWAIDTTFDANKKRFSYRQFSELTDPWFTDEPRGRKIVVPTDFLFGTLVYPFCKEIIIDKEFSSSGREERKRLSLKLSFSGCWGSANPTQMRLAGEPVLDLKTKKVAKALYFPDSLFAIIKEEKCYLRTRLPLGTYRLSYGIRTGLTGFFHEIGYTNFMIISPNRELKITAEKLKASPGVKRRLFGAFSSSLKVK